MGYNPTSFGQIKICIELEKVGFHPIDFMMRFMELTGNKAPRTNKTPVKSTTPIQTMPSPAVGVATARMLLDLALQKETATEGTEDADTARQRAINKLTGSSIILPQKEG